VRRNTVICGCGGMAKGWLRAITEHAALADQIRIVGLVDLDLATAEKLAADFNLTDVRCGTDLAAVLRETKAELLFDIVVPPARMNVVKIGLDHGCHVLSEKPMAYTTDQAASLIEAARRQNLVYAIGYMKRHDAGVARALAELTRLRTDQSLGRIVGARGWCFGGHTGGSRDTFVMTGEARPDGIELWQDGPDWLPATMRPGYDVFLNVFSHIINLTRYLLGPSPEVVDCKVDPSGASRIALDFGGIACALELANGSEGTWREGLTINFERGAMTIELPAPFAEDEARVMLDHDGHRTRLARESSWAFRRQADAFVSDVAARRMPLASGADSITDIALAETIWKRSIIG